MRNFFNGIVGQSGPIPNWERTTVVYPHQLDLHPKEASPETRQPRVVVSDEEQYLDTLGLNKVMSTMGQGGLNEQIKQLIPLREKYPHDLLGVYGIPYVSYGWKCRDSSTQIAYDVWNGHAGTRQDRVDMTEAAHFLTRLLVGDTPPSADMIRADVSVLCPSLYAWDADDGKCYTSALMELTLAKYIKEYAFSTFSKHFSICPFIWNRRRVTGNKDLLSDDEFDRTQLDPMIRAGIDDVFYWSFDSGMLASAQNPNDPDHEESLAQVKEDLEGTELEGSDDWDAIEKWYNRWHQHCLDRVIVRLKPR